MEHSTLRVPTRKSKSSRYSTLGTRFNGTWANGIRAIPHGAPISIFAGAQCGISLLFIIKSIESKKCLCRKFNKCGIRQKFSSMTMPLSLMFYYDFLKQCVTFTYWYSRFQYLGIVKIGMNSRIRPCPAALWRIALKYIKLTVPSAVITPLTFYVHKRLYQTLHKVINNYEIVFVSRLFRLENDRRSW